MHISVHTHTSTPHPPLSLAARAGARAGAGIPTLLVYRPHLQEEADLIHARVLRDEVLEEQVQGTHCLLVQHLARARDKDSWHHIARSPHGLPSSSMRAERYLLP